MKKLDIENDDLLKVIAKYFFKLMAYKDEYEVARLYTNGEFDKNLNKAGLPPYRVKGGHLFRRKTQNL